MLNAIVEKGTKSGGRKNGEERGERKKENDSSGKVKRRNDEGEKVAESLRGCEGSK